ncbi:MAG: Gfo/Idh/MocA family protein [Eubacteriales bacterium]
MKKLRIAQIGIGHDHAGEVFHSLLRQPEQFEVLGYCTGDGEEERIAEMSRRYPGFTKVPRLSLDELLALPGLDAVTVETDDWNLTKYAHIAAERGLPIHMDKPGGLSQSEYEDMLRLVKKNGTAFQTGYMYRYNPAYLALSERIARGELGEIYSVETHMDCEQPASKRAWLGHFKGGMMYFLGCHLIDLIFRIQGVPEEIRAFNSSTGFDGVNTEDVGFAVLRYKNGVSFAKTSSTEPGGFMRRQLVVCGSRETVELRPIERYVDLAAGQMVTDVRSYPANVGWHKESLVTTTKPFDRYDAMMAGFASLVRGERENPYTLEYEARLHRVLLAACGESIDYKGEIKL